MAGVERGDATADLLTRGLFLSLKRQRVVAHRVIEQTPHCRRGRVAAPLHDCGPLLHGTGDVFASTLLAAVMAGRDLACATAFAADFTADAMVVSAKQPDFEARGVSFEPLLGKVTALLG